MRTFVITTLGCKVNQYESAAFADALLDLGLVANQGGDADLVVVNTCAVTGSAGAQSRRAVFQALRRHPRAKVVVCGCYAELEGQSLAGDPRLAGREIVILGNGEKDRLATFSLAASPSPALHLGNIAAEHEITRLPVRRFANRARAHLRIQDGCQSYCSYCIVPHTRGPSRSLPLREVLDQARILADNGHREIVLTGIHLGNYGKDLRPRTTLVELLDALTLATPETGYRISSLEPTEIDTTLLTLMRDRAGIHPHLHIPLQSGSNQILKRMNRHYSSEQFAETVATCLAYLPEAAIGIDIMVGFPGENLELYGESRRFLEALPCTYLHVFPYSIRPGTPAAEYPDQVNAAEKARRVEELLAISHEKTQSFHRRFLGTTRMVLAEGRRDRQGLARGFTDNYIAVRFPVDRPKTGGIVPVRLMALGNDHVLGEIAAP